MIGCLRKFLLLAGLLLPLAGGATHAAESPAPADSTGADPEPAARDSSTATAHRDSVLVLPEVRVERERPAASDGRRRIPTASSSEIDARAAGIASTSLPVVLRQAAGVRITEYGGLGAFSTVSVRGAPAGQVGVYLDGLPLASAAGSAVDLASVPMIAIDRVEVYRGLVPLGFGLPAPAGGINLVSRPMPHGFEGRLTRGSFETWEGSARGSAGRGPVGLELALARQTSRGDFEYPDDNGTPFNPSDDTISVRRNNGFESWSGLGKLDWAVADGLAARLRADMLDRTQGVPGLGAVPALDTQLESGRSIVRLEVERQASRFLPRLRARVAAGREHSAFRDLEGELGLGRHQTDDRFASEEAGLALEHHAWPPHLALAASADVRRERADLRDAADGRPDPPQSRRDQRGAAVTAAFEPAGDRIRLHGGVRWDRIEDALHTVTIGTTVRSTNVTRDLTTPQVGARVRIVRGLDLTGNWTRAERVPDLIELFGNQGSVLGNPALRSERVHNWDAGIRATITSGGRTIGSLAASHFESRADDLILYVRNSQSSVKAMNISRAVIHGEEAEAVLGPFLGVSASAAYTHQVARDGGPVPAWNGKWLPGRPEQQLDARLMASRGRASGFADVFFLGADYLDRYNRQPVPARTILGAGLAWRIVAGLSATLEGRNLTDDQATDVAGFPLPGRTVFLALDVRFPEASTP